MGTINSGTVNHLHSETSPYLLQHAHNPVEWYPWCEEAFERAVAEDKPVFLSIGYSTCHWCHVMAHESFEDQRIADALKHAFISIKVDREERPDVDNVYMRACQLITGSGGWPMSIFMTPNRMPFFAGTYFPPDAFLRLVKAIDRQWRTDRERLLDAAEEISAAMTEHFEGRSVTAIRPQGEQEEAALAQNTEHEVALLQNALASFRSIFDTVNGGFGRAPKFPTPHNLMLLLAHAPHMAEKTLLQMYKGGIFDHIGGGFSRYSTDERWLAPHFEKMLYDNALLAIAYTMAFAKTQNPFYMRAVKHTLAYLQREMASPEGGFYAAQDADTDGEEGKYYLLTPEEVASVLGKDAASAFCARYDIKRGGNFEGKSIPNLLRSAKDVEPEDAETLVLEYTPRQDSDKMTVQECISKLYDYRKIRAALHRDEKQLTGWNALAAAAFAFAGRVFGDASLVSEAERTLTFLEDKLMENDLLYAGYTDGKRSGPGFLDDYAFYIVALIQQFRATEKNRYLELAVHLTERTIDCFWDEEGYGFFFSGTENEALIASVKESYDGAIPSGNSVMAYDLLQLIDLSGKYGGNIMTPDKTKSLISRFRETLRKHRHFMDLRAADSPAGHSFYLFSLFPLKEITCRDGMCSPTGEDVF